MLKVKLGNRTLGQVEEWFIEGLNEGDTFLFSGRVLEYQSISNNNVIVKSQVIHNQNTFLRWRKITSKYRTFN